MLKGDQLGNLIFRVLEKWNDRINGGEFKLLLLYREKKLPRVDKFIISEYQKERIMGRIYANLSHSGD